MCRFPFVAVIQCNMLFFVLCSYNTCDELWPSEGLFSHYIVGKVSRKGEVYVLPRLLILLLPSAKKMPWTWILKYGLVTIPRLWYHQSMTNSHLRLVKLWLALNLVRWEYQDCNDILSLISLAIAADASCSGEYLLTMCIFVRSVCSRMWRIKHGELSTQAGLFNQGTPDTMLWSIPVLTACQWKYWSWLPGTVQKLSWASLPSYNFDAWRLGLWSSCASLKLIGCGSYGDKPDFNHLGCIVGYA